VTANHAAKNSNAGCSAASQCLGRRSVLGDAYVERSLASAGDFNWPMQKLATEFCWDESGIGPDPTGEAAAC
jgi:hypothetical protein